MHSTNRIQHDVHAYLDWKSRVKWLTRIEGDVEIEDMEFTRRGGNLRAVVVDQQLRAKPTFLSLKLTFLSLKTDISQFLPASN